MDMELVRQLDERIVGLRAELAQRTIRLVNIRSVRGEPQPNAPFGEGPRQVLDEVLAWGREAGFYTTDYGVGVISLAMRDAMPDLGIWLHGDVVHEGSGWRFAPYDAVEYKGCIVGRGATDNKGQLVSIFLLLRLFREMGIALNYNPALYVGSNEESGMEDLIGIPGNPDAKGFLNVATPPRLSLVPDSGFSVGYGGKGAVTIKLRSRKPLRNCRLTAGLPDSPGLATAQFPEAVGLDTAAGCKVDGNRLTAWTLPRHSAKPDPNGNMITVLASAMLDTGLAAEEDRNIWAFLRDVSTHVDGDILGIATTSQHMKPLTVCVYQVDDVEGCPEVALNIRYPDGITAEQILERVEAAAAEYGFDMTEGKIGTPMVLADKDAPVVGALCAASDEVMGKVIPPYTLSGGTYGHRLPNAYVYGMNGCLPPDDFPKGTGGAHGVDESVSLDRLERAMRIYARALLRLNETQW